MPFRLLSALAVSLLLHAAVLGAMTWRFDRAPAAATPAMFSATLVHPAGHDPLLKNTLSDGAAAGTPPPAAGKGKPVPTEEAQRRLAEHLYYPPEAIARGLEGEVRLLLSLDVAGNVLDAQVASGSGHDLLDRAAVRAAFAMGRLPGADAREAILPVVFRLR
ncbi:MAG: energy transducer TonB [Candidatus Nitricoxidivorans perseverans]|uniref:Energy transducer TonB n=1 Tax=Candidatus Nitricoxidivorans perseverans TaxID=2975601 RepID=A0AA49IX43_9PROT|nr:MAG: energy transducer TonB [Candidatus Nitricoxidivorans perseverans]